MNDNFKFKPGEIIMTMFLDVDSTIINQIYIADAGKQHKERYKIVIIHKLQLNVDDMQLIREGQICIISFDNLEDPTNSLLALKDKYPELKERIFLYEQ